MATFLSNSPAPDAKFGSALPWCNDQKGCEPLNPPQTAEALAMIIITPPDATKDQIEHIESRIHDCGLRPEVTRGELRGGIGVIAPQHKVQQKPQDPFPPPPHQTPTSNPTTLL